jgi:hypothetical protein
MDFLVCIDGSRLCGDCMDEDAYTDTDSEDTDDEPPRKCRKCRGTAVHHCGFCWGAYCHECALKYMRHEYGLKDMACKECLDALARGEVL